LHDEAKLSLLHPQLSSAGYNMQPDLYLGRDYGTSMNQSPQYSFEYPAEWEEDEITKTEKSTMVGSRHTLQQLVTAGG
jgi:hypothetical protein